MNKSRTEKQLEYGRISTKIIPKIPHKELKKIEDHENKKIQDYHLPRIQQAKEYQEKGFLAKSNKELIKITRDTNDVKEINVINKKIRRNLETLRSDLKYKQQTFQISQFAPSKSQFEEKYTLPYFQGGKKQFF